MEGREAGPGVFSSQAANGWWAGRPGDGPVAVKEHVVGTEGARKVSICSRNSLRHLRSGEH